jgi:hypothetical protein
MPLAEFFDLRKRVNVLKKIKVDGKWRLCPAVIETGGKLKDRVRVHGQIETHLEGSYCIEWREDGKRNYQENNDESAVDSYTSASV